MSSKRNTFRIRNRILLFSFIFGLSLFMGCFIGINSIQPNPSAIPAQIWEEEKVPLVIQQVEAGNLSRDWEPLRIKLADLPVPALYGLTGGNIRVVYYDAENASWVSVPFQIDEKGYSLGYLDGQYIAPSTPSLGAVYGYVSYGSDGTPGIDDDDELVFYAHAGAKVSSSMWWEGDEAGIYPNRIEISIYDPIDNSYAWAYVYYDSLDHGDPLIMGPTVANWADYPEIGWDQGQFRIYSPFYNVTLDKTNPDLETEIRRAFGDTSNGINETPKSFTNMTFLDIANNLSYNWTGAEGNWNNTNYSDTQTEVQYPDSGSFNTEGGSGTIVAAGPIRILITKRVYTNYQINATYSVALLGHQTEAFYFDRKIVNATLIAPTLPGWSTTIDYTYNFVTSLNMSARSNYVVYTGNSTSLTLTRNIPNGVNSDLGELTHSLGPFDSNPQSPVIQNPGIPNFFLFASPTQGSLWMYSPADELGNATVGTYWRDDNETTEIGITIVNATPSQPLNILMQWKYLGQISTQKQARDIGFGIYNQFRPYNLNSFLNYTIQAAPQDKFAPEIEDAIQDPFPAVNNESTTIIARVNDTGVGVHKVLLYYNNGTDTNVVPMEYNIQYDVYVGNIPQQPYLSNIVYWIVANDTYGNTASTAFDFLGAYSFEYDTVGTNPVGLLVSEPPNTEVSVISELNYHRKVVALWDNNSLGGQNPSVGNYMPSSNNGTLEWWMYGMSGPNTKLYTEMINTGSLTTAILLEADWNPLINQLFYYDGTFSSWVPITPISNDTWIHVRLQFYCINRTFTVWIDGIQYGPFPFATGALVPSIDYFQMIMGHPSGGESSGGATVFLDALDASFSNNYYTNRNYDTYQEIRDYKGKYTFELEGQGTWPDEWKVWENGTSNVQVWNEKYKHRNVIEFLDLDSIQTCGMSNNFTARENGTVEWWISGNTLNDPAGAFVMSLRDTAGTDGVVLQADWTTFGNRLRGSDGMAFIDIIPSPQFLRDTWYHIRIEFYCSNTSYNIWVNGIYYGTYQFRIPVMNISELIFETTPLAGTTTLFYTYIDAVDYSWAQGYYPFRSQDYWRHGILNVGYNFTVTDPFPPPKVTGLTVTNTGVGNTLNISWNPSPAQDVEYYIVKMSTNEFYNYNIIANVSVPTTYYVVSNLTDGQTYYFIVWAVDGVPYYSPNSTTKAGIPADNTPPAQVTGVIVDVIPTGNELNITWVANSEPDFDHYNVYRHTISGFTPAPQYLIGSTNKTYWYDTGLIDETTYYYKITAVDDGGPTPNEGIPSVEVNGTPHDSTPPAQVTGLQIFIVPEGNALNLQWNDLNGTTPDLTGYRIYRNSTISGWVLIDTTINPWYNDTGLTDGMVYWYRVAAIDEVPNEGTLSLPVSGTPSDSIAPGAVSITNIAIIPTGNALNITWTASGAADIVGYYLYTASSGSGPYSLLTSIAHPTTYY
ncbi:MAG: fibronectin type III domain-containing protein, partial [Candidatus Helarchaeota archaeon]